MAMFDKHKTGKQNTPEPQSPPVSKPAPSVNAPAPAVKAPRVAMIGQGISISGDVKADSSLKIEGRLEGRAVQCADEIEVAECGHVSANIMAKVVKISGVVTGDIGATEKVLISRTGRVQGNIIAPRVQLEDGALFRGSIDMNPAESARAEKQQASKPAAPNQAKQQKAAPSQAPAQNKADAANTARKEPGLTLKSG